MSTGTKPKEESQKQRYPGLVPFGEEGQALFKGRDREIRDLYNMVMADQLVILYAKSGVGKSSLLNAGLYPELKKHNFYPVRVRFQKVTKTGAVKKEDIKSRHFWSRITGVVSTFFREPGSRNEISPAPTDTSPLSIVVKTIGKIQKDKTVRAISRGLPPGLNGERLWELLKQLAVVTRSSGVSLTPVLVFDQFEELFQFPHSDCLQFAAQLSEALHPMIPKRVAAAIRSAQSGASLPEADVVFWSRQPMVKCIMAIREDKLGSLDLLKGQIPLILRNRYKLYPLNAKNACHAIAGPAAEKGDYVVPPFTFDQGILQKIVDLLGKKNRAAKFTETEIDGSQLQKVCMYIEGKVRARAPHNTDIVVNKTLIDPDSEVQSILDNYYGDQLKTLGSRALLRSARDIIENNLVSRGSRTSVTKLQMEELIKESKRLRHRTSEGDFISALIKARLIKEEFTHLGLTYELSHETLVGSVTRYAEENKLRRLNKKKFWYGFLLSCSLVLLAAVGFLLFIMSKQFNKTHTVLGYNYYQQGNHFYAFNIWDRYTGNLVTAGGDLRRIDRLLDSVNFFDIGLGKNAIYTGDSIISVHERDNSVNTWRLNFSRPGDSVMTNMHIFNVTALESSESNRFIGCRMQDGHFKIYDLKERNWVSNASQAGKQEDGLVNFISGSDFIGYFHQGKLYVQDLVTKRVSPIPVNLGDDGERQSSYFLQNNLEVSSGGKLVTAWTNGKLYQCNIRSGGIDSSVTGVSRFFNRCGGGRLVYEQGHTLVIRQPAGNRDFLLQSDVIGSPDDNRLLFYNGRRRLTVYNCKTGNTEVSVKDYYYLQHKPATINMANNYAAHWFSSDHIQYKSAALTQQDLLLNDSTSQGLELNVNDTLTVGQWRWYLTHDTHQVIGLRAGKIAYRDPMVNASLQDDPNEWYDVRADPQALISGDRQFMAYITRDTDVNFRLNIVSVNTGKKVLTLKNVPGLIPHFTGRYIAVLNWDRQAGIYFTWKKDRGRDYYRSIYPHLTKGELDTLGINSIIGQYGK